MAWYGTAWGEDLVACIALALALLSDVMLKRFCFKVGGRTDGRTDAIGEGKMGMQAEYMSAYVFNLRRKSRRD